MKGFKGRNGREIKPGQLVGVHWNSHKSCWSVVEFKTRKTVGKVLGYAEAVHLENCTVKIDQAKKRKSLETGVKDRHAFIVGEFKSAEKVPKLEREIYYNPYKVESFVDAGSWFGSLDTLAVDYLKHMKAVSMIFKNRPEVTYI